MRRLILALLAAAFFSIGPASMLEGPATRLSPVMGATLSQVAGLLPHAGSAYAQTYDWGDLPEPYYSTTSASSGPSHQIVPNLMIGSFVDAETDGVPEDDAQGDDLFGTTPDDEEGVVPPAALIAGTDAVFDVYVTNNTGSDATLYGFFDMNGNGTFDGVGEPVSVVVPTGTTSTPFQLTFSIPASAPINTPLGLRFRLSNDTGLLSFGAANSGEVTDYMVMVQEPVIGNRVWYDANNNGVIDGFETGYGIDGVTVELLDAGSTVLDSTVTANGGAYEFRGVGVVPDGEYRVRIPASNFSTGNPLAGYVSSAVDGGDPDNDIDDDDNGPGNASGVVTSDVFTFTVGSEPARTVDGDSNATNMTIDFGFTSSCVVGDDDLGGMIFRDYNSDGVQNTREPGWGAGMTVTAYDDAGTATTGTVNPDGSYIIPGVFATASSVRVEFSNLPSWLSPGVVGADSATTVQFHNSPSCAADVAVQNGADFCQADPLIAVPVHVVATTDGADGVRAALNSFDYSSNSYLPTLNTDATHAEIGTTWGTAYQRSTETLFTSAFLKRHAALGPDGPDAIYTLDFSTTPASVSGSTDLQGTAPANIGDPASGGVNIDLGTVDRSSGSDNLLATSVFSPSVDLDAFANVGVMSFGDLDLTEDQDTLWVVNLFQRALIEMDVSSGAIGTTNQYLLSQLSGVPTCTNGVLRPFGLEFNDGVGYLGVVCDASTSQDSADLAGYVLEFDPNAITSGFTTAVTLDLANLRVRQTNWILDNTVSGARYMKPWVSTWADTGLPNSYFSIGAHMQPIISDLDFDESGSMIIGIMDRFGDQGGRANYPPLSGATATVNNRSQGIMVRACNFDGAFVVEDGTTCGNFNFESIGFDTHPRGWTIGDGDGNYYDLLIGDASRTGAGGSLLALKGSNEVMYTTSDPIEAGTNASNTSTWYTNGVHRLQHSDGERVAFATIISQNQGLMGTKGNGLGDLEALCDPAPLEIGNYVWWDADNDGVQDPSEAGIGGATVQLIDTDGTTVLATAVTDAYGRYLFSNDPNGVNTASRIYDVTLLPDTSGYELRVATTQSRLTGYTLTTANAAGGSTLPDGVDSDAILVSTNALIDVTTGAAGVNDHTDDIGFFAEPALLGDFVWNDLNKDGTQDAGEPGIAGVTLVLWDDFGTQVATTTTNATGYYSFTVMPGVAYTVQVEAQEFFADGELYGFTPSPLGQESVGSINTNESPPVSVPAGNSDLTVDFGFYADGKSLLGDYVWLDHDLNGDHDTVAEVEYTSGIDGVLINVYRDLGTPGVFEPGIDTLWTVTTTGDDPDTTGTQTGWYNVPVIGLESYWVEIDPSNFDPGGPLENAIFTNGYGSVYPNSEPQLAIIASDPTQVLDVDFGYFFPMSIGSLIWEDLNSDGIQDPGEPGIDGATVSLLVDNGSGAFIGATDIDGNAVTDQTTDTDGLYYFDNLPEGTYKIRVTPPAGYSAGPVQTTTNDDNTANDSNIASENAGVFDSTTLILVSGGTELVETGGYAGDDQDDGADADGNMTLDMAFVQQLPALAILKVLNTPEPVRVGDPISFTITITNTGPTTIAILPLEDTYDTDYIGYVNATPASVDNTDDGTINWTDLTVSFGSDLAPGAAFQVDVNFIAQRDTTLLVNESTINYAAVSGAEDTNGTTPDDATDNDDVSVANPTGVYFTNRSSVRDGGMVNLSWTTADESQIAAFRVVRTNSDGTEVMLTADAIVALFSGQPQGSVYRFTDADLAGQGRVHYDLEVIGLDGSVNRLDLGRVHVGSNMYMPLVAR